MNMNKDYKKNISSKNISLKNIVLIGMMGCGKTTVGQVISQWSSMPFTDTDAMIEDKLKMTIPHIFEQYGESFFRDQESEVARVLSSCRGTVIATGGGMVINPKNMTLLGGSGFVVYLRLPADQLQKRTNHDENRPLLPRLKELLVHREPLYTRYSNLVIDADGTDADQLAGMILHEYRNYKRT